MSVHRIATRYARSLIELATEQGKLKRILEDVETFREISQSRDFLLFLKNPIIHADRKADAAMKPRMILDGPPPTMRIVMRANRLWSFHFSMVRAIMKPPMNRKMVLLK